MKYRAIYCSNNPDMIDYVYSEAQQKFLAEQLDMQSEVVNIANLDAVDTKDVEIMFSTWGMEAFSKEQLVKYFPKLKVLFFAAGATDYFVRPFFELNIPVISAWQANAIPVAEFCLGEILLSLKGFFRNQNAYVNGDNYNAIRSTEVGPGVYGAEVALIGAGAISSKLQELLKNFNVKVTVVPSRKERRTVSLEEVFARAQVVSNHLPNRTDNVGVIDGKLLGSMKPGAVFINTGRGAQVNEKELIEVMQQRPDLTALLDVTEPEPPVANSPLYSLQNVKLTTHIAGSLNDEVHRMADYVIGELEAFLQNRPFKYAVTESMLITSRK